MRPGSRPHITVVVAMLAIAAAGAVSHADVDSSWITDIELHFSDGGAYLIFIDGAGEANSTSGSVTFYKKTTRFSDVPKMEGRGVSQQIVMERIPSETYVPIMTRQFFPSDFQDIASSVGWSYPVLPVMLPVKEGDMVRVEFGDVHRDVTVDY